MAKWLTQEQFDRVLVTLRSLEVYGDQDLIDIPVWSPPKPQLRPGAIPPKRGMIVITFRRRAPNRGEYVDITWGTLDWELWDEIQIAEEWLVDEMNRLD